MVASGTPAWDAPKNDLHVLDGVPGDDGRVLAGAQAELAEQRCRRRGPCARPAPRSCAIALALRVGDLAGRALHGRPHTARQSSGAGRKTGSSAVCGFHAGAGRQLRQPEDPQRVVPHHQAPGLLAHAERLRSPPPRAQGRSPASRCRTAPFRGRRYWRSARTALASASAHRRRPAMYTFSCFQHMEIISSVQGMPMWMPMSRSSGKSMATGRGRSGARRSAGGAAREYTRLWPTCIMIGNVELAALGVVRVVLGVVRAPVHTSADTGARPTKPSSFTARSRSRKPCMPRNGSMPARPEKRVGMLPADLVDALVGNLEGTTDVDVAGPDRDQQRTLDAGAVHLLRDSARS